MKESLQELDATLNGTLSRAVWTQDSELGTAGTGLGTFIGAQCQEYRGLQNSRYYSRLQNPSPTREAPVLAEGTDLLVSSCAGAVVTA